MLRLVNYWMKKVNRLQTFDKSKVSSFQPNQNGNTPQEKVVGKFNSATGKMLPDLRR
jgi:hypothetical protein